MTNLDRAILAVVRRFIPPGWELVYAPPEIMARNYGDGTGRLAFGFYLRQELPSDRGD